MIRIVVSTLLLALFIAGPAPAQVKESIVDQINKALPDKAPAQSKQPRKILVYSKTVGFRHSSIPVGVKAISMMGDKTGAYTVLATEDESFFEPEKLKTFDLVFMLNTTGNCLMPKGLGKEETKAREEILKASLQAFVSGGKGLVGVHSATDTYGSWPAYNKMMGGAFDQHPWHAKVPIKNQAPSHPLNAAFNGADFEIADEIYQFRADTARPDERKFLLSLDNAKMDVSKGKRKDGTYPISWYAPYEKGRTFYCSLGHRDEIYWNPAILRHYLAGIQYALGDLKVE